MSNISPQAKAGLAKEFASTEYGKWFLYELRRREQAHRDIADNTDATNMIVNHTMKAAGIKEAINVIAHDVKMADSPAFKNMK